MHVRAIQASICMHVYIYIYVCMYVYIYIYIHTHTQTHIHMRGTSKGRSCSFLGSLPSDFPCQITRNPKDGLDGMCNSYRHMDKICMIQNMVYLTQQLSCKHRQVYIIHKMVCARFATRVHAYTCTHRHKHTCVYT